MEVPIPFPLILGRAGSRISRSSLYSRSRFCLFAWCCWYTCAAVVTPPNRSLLPESVSFFIAPPSSMRQTRLLTWRCQLYSRLSLAELAHASPGLLRVRDHVFAYLPGAAGTPAQPW